ncbi:hypothetical protein CIN01S_15_00860 [Chryseobacterium indologenes NBRC 14944]|nr:hypothetical protein CIN01S_15_00860 [Chryseobacterium indologenes NBRC 14944]
MTSEIIGKSNRINWPIDLRYRHPSLDEQGNIEKLLSSLDEKINIEKTLLKKYEIQKKNLLQNLFI